MSTPGTAFRTLIVALGASLSCLAQSTAFGVSSGSGIPGSTVTLDISLDTSSGTSPASVEWTLSYPATDISSATVTPGSAAAGAGKSVACTNTAGSATCVLWGDNSTAMSNGVVATVALVLAPTAPDASSQVQLSVPIAADPAGFPLTASATGGLVTIEQPAALGGFSCSPSSVSPPATSTCTLALTANAPTGGASVALTSSLADVIIPTTVAIPPGANSATFLVSPIAVSVPASLNLNASYLGVNEGFGLTVEPPTAMLTGISLSPATLAGGLTLSGTVTLSSPAGSGGVSVALSSSSPLALTVPAYIVVPQGSSTATFPCTTLNVLLQTSVVLTGSYLGSNVSQTLSVLPRPHALNGLTVTPNSIESGQTATGMVTLAAPAGSGGVVIQIYCSNTSALTAPSSVTVPQGSRGVSFTVTAGSVSANTSVALEAYHAGLQEVVDLTVRPR